MPFRRAHEVVGHLVLLCDKRGCRLDDLAFEDFREQSDLFEEDIVDCLDLASIVEARDTIGGTSSHQVAHQIEALRSQIAQDKTSI